MELNLTAICSGQLITFCLIGKQPIAAEGYRPGERGLEPVSHRIELIGYN